MGRWAQAKRRGGGPTAAALIEIIGTTIESEFEVTLTYNGLVDNDDFAFDDFATVPNTAIPDTVQQGAPNQLVLIWPESIAGETGINYAGDTPGVLTPQTVTF